jgi:hypothetical protein
MITVNTPVNILLLVGSFLVILIGLISSFWFLRLKEKVRIFWRTIFLFLFTGCEFLGAFMLYSSGIKVVKFSGVLQEICFALFLLMSLSLFVLFIVSPRNRKVYVFFTAVFSTSSGLFAAVLSWASFCM